MAYKDHIRRVLRYYYWGVVILLLLLLLSSWLLGIYVDGVQGLLTPRGIRWMCSNIVPNFASVHWAKILLGVMAVGVLNESGLFRTLRGHISLKQQRALLITGGVVVFVLSLFSLLLFLPNAVLLSAFGTFSHSAFSKGFYGLVMGLAILIGNVYGATMGRFVSMRDFVQAHVAIFSTVASYFVIVFLASQFVGCLEFTGILTLLGDDGMGLHILQEILYHLPLLLYILLAL